MERQNINAKARSASGTSASRQLRRESLVPGVVYGRGKDPINVAVDREDLAAAISAGGYSTQIFDLKLAGGDAAPTAVMIKQIQRDPLRGTLLNVDLHAISLTEKVHASVPVKFTGEPDAVKRGAIIERLHSEVSVSCLPTSIPSQLEIDISELGIGDAVHAKDLVLSGDVELLSNPEEVLLIIAHAAKPAEEVAAPAEEGEEPEVIGKKKEEEEE